MPEMQRKGKKSVRNSPEDTKVREEGRGGGAGPGAREETVVQQGYLKELQPMEGPTLE